MRKILLTGEVGVGKSTVVDRVLHLLDFPFGGFRTERLSAGGRLIGFRIVDIGTYSAGPIAKIAGEGRLIPHPQAFEDIGVQAIDRALASKDLIVMDELGFLELEAPRFQEMVLAALKGPKPVLGVLKRGHNSFLDGIRALDDVEVIEVREDNRDRLPLEIAKALKGDRVR